MQWHQVELGHTIGQDLAYFSIFLIVVIGATYCLEVLLGEAE